MSDEADSTSAPSFPLQEYLGMELSSTEVGAGTATLHLDDQHANPNGVAHGAVLFALVDTAMGKATMSVIDDNLYCASVELSLRFIRPASEGELIAEATVVKRGSQHRAPRSASARRRSPARRHQFGHLCHPRRLMATPASQRRRLHRRLECESGSSTAGCSHDR